MMTVTFPREPLLLEPHLTERPWGGDRMAVELGKKLPPGRPIGEAWEFSDHPNGRSRVVGGTFDGQFIGDVLRAHPRETVGRDELGERHPLLVKFIDAREDLSLQVHPPDAYAIPRGDRGKSECWYVMRADPGAELIFGLVPGTTRDSLARAIAEGRAAHKVLRFPLQAGTFLMVHPGNVHAILRGTLVCEIQQSSDTTYRIWDWGRQPARQLHIEDSLNVINFQEQLVPPWCIARPGRLPAKGLRLTTNEYFTVRAYDASPDTRIVPQPAAKRTGLVVVGIEGTAVLDTGHAKVGLPRGRTAFVPACCQDDLVVRCLGEDVARILVTESREL
jgi:mannose-6-phosphate isomerase